MHFAAVLPTETLLIAGVVEVSPGKSIQYASSWCNFKEAHGTAEYGNSHALV